MPLSPKVAREKELEALSAKTPYYVAQDESKKRHFWQKDHTMRKPETISFHRKRLPHWSVMDGLYFVTIRQKDTIPRDAAMKIREKVLELEKYEDSEQILIRKKIFLEMENWLDRSDAEGILVKGKSPQIIKEAIQFRVETGVWRMIEYVIMPNHLHLFFAIENGNL